MPNCTNALASGLMLFAWTCAGCGPSWSALFVVNGQASAPGDISLGPLKLLGLSVRKNQFKPTDCVAIRIYNPANAAQNATSNAVCLSSALAVHAITPVGGTNPSLSHQKILNLNSVPAPTGMGITHDAPTCTAHGGFGGGLACSAGLQAGMLALIWNCPSCKVDGYRLYRVDGGRHDLQQSNGAYGNDATVTLALPNPPGDGFNGKCYAVTAYKSSNESALSNWACAGAGSTATTTTLSATHTLHWQRARGSRTGTIGYTDQPNDQYDATLYVGYADHYGENTFGDIYYDRFNRSGVVFDLSSLAGHPISKAVLKLSALSSWHDYSNHDWQTAYNLSAQSPMACVAIVDLATDHWWLNNDLASTVSYVAPGAFMGPDFAIDVTSAITNWTSSSYAAASDFGFVLRGDDENDQWHGNANHVCLTQLQSVSLVVTYY